MIIKIKIILNHAKEWFSLQGVLAQLSIVIFIGFLVVLLSGFFLGSVEDSYNIFVDPQSLFTENKGYIRMTYSFLLMLFGLVVAGFIISVLSSSLEQTFRDIRRGRLDFIGQDHTMIINYNEKILNILDEINKLHIKSQAIHDVIIIIANDDKIEHLQDIIKDSHFSNLKIRVRFGDVYSIHRYKELSLLESNALIILSDETIEDEFIRDNNNLKIVNILYRDEEFKTVLENNRKIYKPNKIVVEFTNYKYFTKLISNITDSYFIAIAPKEILSSILNISILNIDFYNIWSQLLSYDGHEIYFVNPAEHNLIGSTYKDILLRHQNGMMIGLSRATESSFEILLNANEETIYQTDFLIFIAKEMGSISFKEKPISYENDIADNTSRKIHLINQPEVTFVRNILIIGDHLMLSNNNFINMEKSTVLYSNPNRGDLFSKEYYDDWLAAEFDSIVINLNDEMMYRVAFELQVLYSMKELEVFVFLTNNDLISDQLFKAGFHNTISSNLFFSKYISQVSRQITLDKVFNMLFVDHTKINFLNTSEIPKEFLSDINRLRYQLVNNNMSYLGCVDNNENIIFESTDVEKASKIIVLTNG